MLRRICAVRGLDPELGPKVHLPHPASVKILLGPQLNPVPSLSLLSPPECSQASVFMFGLARPNCGSFSHQLFHQADIKYDYKFT
jgi:hypothetical protein